MPGICSVAWLAMAALAADPNDGTPRSGRVDTRPPRLAAYQPNDTFRGTAAEEPLPTRREIPAHDPVYTDPPLLETPRLPPARRPAAPARNNEEAWDRAPREHLADRGYSRAGAVSDTALPSSLPSEPARSAALPSDARNDTLPRVGAAGGLPDKDVASKEALGKPLKGASRRSSDKAAAKFSAEHRGVGGSLFGAFSGLMVVVGLFLLAAWMLRRRLPRSMSRLPSEVVEVLGQSPFAKGQRLNLLRVGGKLLLVNVTNLGAETLTEIADPAEVDRLVGLCAQQRDGSTTENFSDTLAEYEREGAARTVKRTAEDLLAALGVARRTSNSKEASRA